jgi:hypothetical protein
MSHASLLLALLGALSGTAHAAIGPLNAIRITTGVPIDPNKSPVNKPICLAHAWAEDKLLVSANYPNGLPYSYYVVEQDGGLTPWSDTKGLTGEIMLDTVPANNPQYVPGDLFGGNGRSGEIMRLTDKGARRIQSWCNLAQMTAGQTIGGQTAPSSPGLLRGALHFDRHGEWNYDLVAVATAGHVYRVEAGDTQCSKVTFLGSAGRHLEGMTVLPKSARWGKFGGGAVIGAEQQGDAWVWWPNGTHVRIPGIGARIEDLDEVPFDERDSYYIVNYGSNAIYAVDYTQFAGHAGKVLVTQEASAFFELEFDQARDTLKCTRITLNGYGGGSTEQATFSQSGVNEILPADFSLCIDATSNSGTSSISTVKLADTGLTAVSNYRYGQVTPRSARALMKNHPASDELWVFFTQDWRNQFTLHVMTGTMGAPADFDVTVSTKSTAASDPLGSSVRLLVQDDPDDTLSLTRATGGATGSFSVAAGETDGFVIGPIDFVPMRSLVSLTVDVRVTSGSFSGGMKVASQPDPKQPVTTSAFTGVLTLKRVHCNCGNGRLDRAEQCDWAIPGSMPCCTKNCAFASPNTECRNASDVCDTPEFCSGRSLACPVDSFVPGAAQVQCGFNASFGKPCSYCDGNGPSCPPVANNPSNCPSCNSLSNCTGHGNCVGSPPKCVCNTGVANPYTGNLCDIPDCSKLTSCSSCSLHPACGWCCTGSGKGFCTAGNAQAPADTAIVPNSATCPTYQFANCNCAQSCLNNGTCTCGACACVPPFGGNACGLRIDCRGVVGGNATFDLCGCDAGNTACVGCDGLPFGKRLDKCGVCGGNGESCFDPCPGATCEECANTPECVFCRTGEDDACVPDTQASGCDLLGDDATSCAAFKVGLTEEEAAAVGAGILAGIIIGAVACVALAGGGSYGGYKLLEKWKDNLHGVDQSPLYEDEALRGVNPLQEERDDMSFLKPGVTNKAEQYGTGHDE